MKKLRDILSEKSNTEKPMSGFEVIRNLLVGKPKPTPPSEVLPVEPLSKVDITQNQMPDIDGGITPVKMKGPDIPKGKRIYPDVAEKPQWAKDTKMKQLQNDIKSKEFDKKFQAQMAEVDRRTKEGPKPKTEPKLEPKVGSLVAPQSGYPAAEKPKAPIPKLKPELDTKVIGKGDTLWDIAGGDAKRVKELQKLNPGLNPKKMAIGYKLKLK